MKRIAAIALIVLALCLLGYGAVRNVSAGTASKKIVYSSEVLSEDCFLCGNGMSEDSIPFYWGQENIALISLNTFEMKPIEINRYDIDGKMIEEAIGAVSFGGGASKDGGFSATVLLDYDRGYATGSMEFHDDKTLDIDKAVTFLCAECLNEILPQDIEQCFGVGVISLATKEIHIFEQCVTGFGLGDFYIDCDLKEPSRGSCQMSLFIVYCPIRYEERS